MKYYALLSFLLATFTIGCVDDKDNPAPTLTPVKPIICNCTETPLMFMADNAFVVFPTAFTPNADSRNDLFAPVTFADSVFTNFHLTVLNTDSVVVFNTNNVNSAWLPTIDTAIRSTKYYYKVKWATKNGNTVDTCGCVQALWYPFQGCLDSSASMYYFHDQVDPNTGLFMYQTGENFCK